MLLYQFATMLQIRAVEGKGVGVFATGVISKGTLVARYPNIHAPPGYEGDYKLGRRGQPAVIGRPWMGKIPSKKIKLGEPVAHLFNDAAKLEGGATTLKEFQHCLSGYCAAADLGGNVQRVGDSLDFVAKRDIQVDEELLFAYGASFWVVRQYNQDVVNMHNTLVMNGLMVASRGGPAVVARFGMEFLKRPKMEAVYSILGRWEIQSYGIDPDIDGIFGNGNTTLQDAIGAMRRMAGDSRYNPVTCSWD